jgi:hypothetical protein
MKPTANSRSAQWPSRSMKNTATGPGTSRSSRCASPNGGNEKLAWTTYTSPNNAVATSIAATPATNASDVRSRRSLVVTIGASNPDPWARPGWPGQEVAS